jgi:cytochrome P450
VCSLQVDPYADEFQQSPFAAYAALRATAPVYQVPDLGFFLVTTHALVREVLHDAVTYAISVTSARRTEPPPVYNRLHAISTRYPGQLRTNKFDFTLLGLSKSDLEVVRSMPQ